jgi:hypothetical protein
MSDRAAQEVLDFDVPLPPTEDEMPLLPILDMDAFERRQGGAA